MKKKIDELIINSIAERVFPGAVVLLAGSRGVEDLKSYGTTRYSDPESVKVEDDFIYDIASVIKLFTYTLGLILLEKGKFTLKSKVADFLPGFSSTEKSQITIWNLFTHSSGLSCKHSEYVDSNTKDGIKTYVLNSTVKYKPGSRVLYDNINAMLMGMLIETVERASLDILIANYITIPLDMRDTMFNPPSELRPMIVPTEYAWHYNGDLAWGKVHDGAACEFGGIAGHAGLFSTATDLWKFVSGLMGIGQNCSRLVSPKILNEAFKVQLSSESVIMGLGFKIYENNIVGHAGHTGTAIYFDPHSNKACILLSNRDYPKRTDPKFIDNVRKELRSIFLKLCND